MIDNHLHKRKKHMSEHTTQVDPRNVLCRVVDVNSAIQDAFQKFVNSEKKSLDELAEVLREELSQIEFFAPSDTSGTQE